MQLSCTTGLIHMIKTIMAPKTGFMLFDKHELCRGGGSIELQQQGMYVNMYVCMYVGMYVWQRETNTRELFFISVPLSSGIIHVSANRVEALIKHLLPFMPSTSSHALPPQRGRKVNLSPPPPPPEERFLCGRRPLKWFESVLVAWTLMTHNTMINTWKSCKFRASVTRRSQKWLSRRKGNISRR